MAAIYFPLPFHFIWTARTFSLTISENHDRAMASYGVDSFHLAAHMVLACRQRAWSKSRPFTTAIPRSRRRVWFCPWLLPEPFHRCSVIDDNKANDTWMLYIYSFAQSPFPSSHDGLFLHAGKSVASGTEYGTHLLYDRW